MDDGSRLSRKNNRARCDGISIQIEWSGTPGSNPSSLGACFSKAPKSCSKISDPMTGKLFYVHIFNMNSCPFHARSFRRIHLSVFPDILLCSWGRPGLGQDTLFSQCLSPPRCVNRYRMGVPLQWTSILAMGRRVGRVQIPLVTSFY